MGWFLRTVVIFPVLMACSTGCPAFGKFSADITWVPTCSLNYVPPRSWKGTKQYCIVAGNWTRNQIDIKLCRKSIIQ
ncbi:hypothetical protein V1508DRAFT_417544 [Lipomyces doorenjongii]|uniref:uncharacterized protein n=1 Tax=Lipomyces doorenjongii TaxID=383834 RepID=UPI0034CE0CB6